MIAPAPEIPETEWERVLTKQDFGDKIAKRLETKRGPDLEN
jgi:hypothetical protein